MYKSFAFILMALCLTIPVTSFADVKADSYGNDPDITAPGAPLEPIQQQIDVIPLEMQYGKEKRFSFLTTTNQFISVIAFVAVTDQVTINEVIVNRGNRVYAPEHRSLPITLNFGDVLVLKDITREKEEIAAVERNKGKHRGAIDQATALLQEDRNIKPSFAAPKETIVHTNLGSYIFKQ